jgi:methylation protein EvaC
MNCAICASRDIATVLDMGEMALAGGFLKREQFAAEKRYPLRLGFCRTCKSLQVLDRVGPEQLFGTYFYRSSTSEAARAHFAQYARSLVDRFRPGVVVEIGCNDGVMLEPLSQMVETVIGVDPSDAARNVSIPRVAVWRSYFNEHAARQIGKADLIVANNVLAHVENLNEVMRGVRAMLNPGGALVMECHYLGSVLAGQYDAIYHEHVFYHSLISLENLCRMWGLEVFDVRAIPTHGGSMRYFIGRRGEHHVEPRVDELRHEELQRGMDREETYTSLETKALDHRRVLMGLLNRLKRERASIVGYGAAGRANTLMQWCGFEGHLDYVVDDCEAKQGFYTPGTHYEIRSPDELERDPPDCLLVLAWPYLSEIRERVVSFHGNVIMPMPEVAMHRFYVQGGERMVA